MSESIAFYSRDLDAARKNLANAGLSMMTLNAPVEDGILQVGLPGEVAKDFPTKTPVKVLSDGSNITIRRADGEPMRAVRTEIDDIAGTKVDLEMLKRGVTEVIFSRKGPRKTPDQGWQTEWETKEALDRGLAESFAGTIGTSCTMKLNKKTL